MSSRFSYLAISILVVAVLSACDQDSGSSAPRHRTDGPAVDEAGRLIQQVKEDLADDRIGQATALMDRLLAIRSAQPLSRQVEIDRLDAMFAAERAPAAAGRSSLARP